MVMRQTQRLRDLHTDAVSEFDQVYEVQRPEREQALQDRRFYSIAGAMWEGDLGEQFDNRPKVEVNKIHLAVIRLFNEYRNNRMDADFVSKDGVDNSDLAEACDMLYRADEQDSCASEAYDNGFDEAVGGGMGAWRLRADYEDEEDEDNESQRIKIEPIHDADQCVFFDLDAKRQDKSDARRCWVLTGMTRDAFKAEWEKEPVSFEKGSEPRAFDWCTPDTVYVAEFYEKEKIKTTIDTWRHPVSEEERKVTESEYEDDESLRSTLEDTGWELVKSRKIKESRVRKYIMDGAEILEDCGLIAGKHIPIVPVYGKRWYVDGIERFMGAVRLAKDAQRLKNIQLSQLAFIAAMSPIEKPILMPEQVAGHELLWANDHTENNPFLLINPIRDDAGNMVVGSPIGYTKPPTLSPAMAALLQITEQDMSDILGNQQQGEQMEANQSGKAVELIQNRIDKQSFIYLDNMGKAVRRSGEIWLSMARELFTEAGRKMKGVTKQNAAESVELKRPALKDGAAVLENDLSRAEFDVAVTVGPSSDTKRQATVRGLTNIAMITQDEQTKKILLATAMQNMDGEGLSDLREYYRRQMVAMGVIDPTEEDKKRMAEEQANTPPDPNAKYLEAAAAKDLAQAKKLGADTVLSLNKAAETEVNMLKTITEFDLNAAQAQQSQMNPPAVGEQGPAPMNAEQGSMNAEQEIPPAIA
jgi:hypothetical protein